MKKKSEKCEDKLQENSRNKNYWKIPKEIAYKFQWKKFQEKLKEIFKKWPKNPTKQGKKICFQTSQTNDEKMQKKAENWKRKNRWNVKKIVGKRQ